jgi:two-component system LytT family response regulator
MTKITAIIVDDEPYARQGIKIHLRGFPEIEVLGELSTGDETVSRINAESPDILFLDIQMPGMNGFELLSKLTTEPPPFVIFITAYDTYAIRAFEFHALDYLLKPISDDRFKEAVGNAKQAVKLRDIGNYSNRIKSVISDYWNVIQEKPEKKNFLNRLMIKTNDESIVIATEEIDWIESAGDYAYIHIDFKKHLIKETMIALEQKLDPNKFIRIHRSTIVNIDKVRSLKQNKHGDSDIFLKNGEKLRMSRNYRGSFQNSIGSLL